MTISVLPTRKEFLQVIEKAKVAGRDAAVSRYNALAAKCKPSNKLLDHCGGALLILDVDGRSAFGRFIRGLIQDPIPNVSISKYRYGGYILQITDIAPFQEQSIREAAQEKALEVIRNSFGIKGRVESYDS